MSLHTARTAPAEMAADAIVVGVFDGGTLTGPAKEIDEASGGLLSMLVTRKEITGRANETIFLHGPTGISAPLVVALGLGPQTKLTPGVAFRAAGSAAKALAGKERKVVAYFLGEELSAGEKLSQAAAGLIVGSVGQDLYRAEKKLFAPGEVYVQSNDEAALQAGEIVGQAMNLTRELVNTPPDRMYPVSFAERANQVASECGLQCEIWDQAKLEAERCGALLAVAKGSDKEPRLVILRYQGGEESGQALGLIGKGVTFDSGGLSLKPSDSMLTMKCDMAGAATVLGAISAIAKLKLPINVIALMGLVENMTGPAAYKLGDVLTARNGTTIEIHNTDAEGRLVLADVLDVAIDQGATHLIDLATLTGACLVALGLDVAGVMTNNQPWGSDVLEAANRAGELVWQLPMFSEYNELIKSDVADIKNVGQGRWGGAITAAKFLEQFVRDQPWTHIDIAGPAFREKPKAWCDAGGTGELLRTLVEVARMWRP